MALYRQDSTGFLCEFASSPGAGYTAVSAQPTDTITNRTNWWRARDVDAALGQSSIWHPSLQASNPEVPRPPGLAGSGVNVCSWRYAAFEEASLPPLASTSCTPSQQTGGYSGAKCLRLTATAASGETYLNGSASQYNIKVTENRRWIISLRARSITVGSRQFTVLVKTSGAGAVYASLTFTTGSAGAWARYSGLLDLRVDASPKAVMGLRIAVSGAIVEFDEIMMEEQIGDGTEPSAYSAPLATVNGAQLDDGSIPDAKIITLTANKLTAGTIDASQITVTNLNASNIVTGTLNGTNINVTNLNASNLTVGTINGARFGANTIQSGPIISGEMHRIQAGAFEPYSIVRIDSTSLSVSSTWIGPLTVPSNSNRSAILIWVSMLPLSSPVVAGRIVAGIGRDSTSAALAYSTFVQGLSVGQTGTLTFVFYDASPGTGAHNYYCGMQHSITSSGSINVRVNWGLLEISK